MSVHSTCKKNYVEMERIIYLADSGMGIHSHISFCLALKFVCHTLSSARRHHRITSLWPVTTPVQKKEERKKMREKKKESHTMKFLLAIHNMKAKQRMCYCFNHIEKEVQKKDVSVSTQEKRRRRKNTRNIAYLPMLLVEYGEEKKLNRIPKDFIYFSCSFVSISQSFCLKKHLYLSVFDFDMGEKLRK